jgi:DNA segregation ATPase FtsK/SpoIIIE and related proteins
MQIRSTTKQLSLFSSRLQVNTKYVAHAKINDPIAFIFQIFSSLAISLIVILSLTFGMKKELIILFLILIAILILTSKNENKKINLIWSLRFAEFLKSNKLTTTSRIENRTEILDSAVIIYWVDEKNNFHLQVFGEGRFYSKQTQELDVELMSFLGLPLSDKMITASHTEYVFRTVNSHRQTMTEAFQVKNNDKYIVKLNEQFDWDLIQHPHALIAGGTGTGKTALLLALILMINGEIAIIDPKRSDLFNVGKQYFANSTVSETTQIIELLKNYTQIMDDRYTQLFNSKTIIGASIKDLNLQPIFLFFDEVAAAVVNADNKEKKEMIKYLTQLILKGRQAGINIVLATQRPDADIIPANLRDQLSIRIGLGNLSKEGQRMMFGSLDRELLNFSSSEKGLGYIQISGLHQQPQEFRSTFWNSDFDFQEQMNELTKI